MSNPDAVRLKHMLDAAGEAAAKVSEETRHRHAAIPWDAIVATRNRLVHGYFDINLDIVWDTVTIDLPPLVAELRKAI